MSRRRRNPASFWGFVNAHPVWSFLGLVVVSSSAVGLVAAARGTPAAGTTTRELS